MLADTQGALVVMKIVSAVIMPIVNVVILYCHNNSNVAILAFCDYRPLCYNIALPGEFTIVLISYTLPLYASSISAVAYAA